MKLDQNVCHHFQEELYAYFWSTRKISHVPCFRILLPGEQYANGDSHRATVVAICEGRVRIELLW